MTAVRMGRREAARLGLPCLILAALLGGCATVESDRTLDAGAPWLTLDGRALPSLALDQTQRQRMNDRRARLLADPLDERGREHALDLVADRVLGDEATQRDRHELPEPQVGEHRLEQVRRDKGDVVLEVVGEP